jgi:high-affinity K+ transport system ATPase subunit B
MKITELRQIIKNTIKEMSLPEMARTAGTGGAYSITPEGEAVIKQAKATNTLPEGIRASHLQILAFLFKAKQDGTRAQKKTFADEKGVPQPAVNALFNQLEEKGLVSKEAYQGFSTGPKNPAKPKASVEDILGDLDI